jgi:hypothetical protein
MKWMARRILSESSLLRLYCCLPHEVGYYMCKRRLFGETQQDRVGLIRSRLQSSAARTDFRFHLKGKPRASRRGVRSPFMHTPRAIQACRRAAAGIAW